MKKHLVDDLFKSKLSGLEKRPSSAAWEKIAREQKSHGRKVAIWVWYAAAGILVTFMAGYLAWQSSQQVSVGRPVAKISEPERVVIAAPHDEVKTIDSIMEAVKEPVEQQLAAVESEGLSIGLKRSIGAKTGNEAEAKKIVMNVEIPENNLPKVEQIASLPVNDRKVDLPELLSSNADKQIINESFVGNEELKDENRTIVVNVEMPDNDSGEKGKSSRFAKVFRQLKNARAGEKVDWEEVGFNPKDVLAKVDGRGRNREDQNSDKYLNTKRTKL